MELKKVDYKRKPQDLRPGEYMIMPIQRARNFIARWKPGMNLPSQGRELPIICRGCKLWLVNCRGKFELRRYQR